MCGAALKMSVVVCRRSWTRIIFGGPAPEAVDVRWPGWSFVQPQKLGDRFEQNGMATMIGDILVFETRVGYENNLSMSSGRMLLYSLCWVMKKSLQLFSVNNRKVALRLD